MLTTILSEPDQRIQDPSLAWDMAHAEKPYRELEQHARELNLGGVAVNMAEKADSASEDVRLRSSQSQTEQADPMVESTLNPYERLTDEQLETVKANITDSVVRGVKCYDLKRVTRSGINLFAVQRELERRSSGAGTAPVRGIMPGGFCQVTMPEASTVEGIIGALKDTEGASEIAFGLRNTVEDEFMQDGKFPSDEALLESAEVKQLLAEVARGLQSLNSGEPLKNPYSRKSNEEIQEIAGRFDVTIPDLEATGRIDEAIQAKALRAQVQEVIDRRHSAVID